MVSAVQGESLSVPMVKVGLDAVLPGLGHGLDTGLGLLAPPRAASPAANIAIVTVTAVSTVKAVTQGVT